MAALPAEAPLPAARACADGGLVARGAGGRGGRERRLSGGGGGEAISEEEEQEKGGEEERAARRRPLQAAGPPVATGRPSVRVAPPHAQRSSLMPRRAAMPVLLQCAPQRRRADWHCLSMAAGVDLAPAARPRREPRPNT